MVKSDTFCILPWIHAATYNDGSALLCCVAKTSGLNLNTSNWTKIWNSNHFTEARLAMLGGRKFPACEACYKEEANGIKSHRQNENHYWYQQLDTTYLDDLVAGTNKNGTVDHDIITLDLRLGNTCNLQCVMCGPKDSSKWIKDAETLSNSLQTDARYDWKHKIETFASEKFEWYKNEEFWDDFFTHAKDIKHIIFGGGEPLYIKEHKTLIKRLVESGLSKNIELRYHTNCTIYSPEIVELWEHFEKVELMLSIDGYDWVNSYIRHPADWAIIEKNFKAYCELPENIHVKVLCTVQALNINWLPEFADWMMSLDLEKIKRDNKGGIFFLGILHWPPYLCSKSLPADKKEKITKKLQEYIDKHPDNKLVSRFTGLISFMNSEDWSHLYPQMLDYVNGLDELHGTTHARLLDI